MKPKATKGVCTRCRKEYARAGMAKHLTKCVESEVKTMPGKKSGPCFLLQVSSQFTSAYWLHLQVDANASLNALDSFLRDIWLECCGHMSKFYTGRQTIALSRKLVSFLEPGMEIGYDYDMGDTTSLTIKVLDAYQGLIAPKKPVEILARNQPPEIPCDECKGSPAVRICPECQWEGEGWLCEACAATHKCGDEDYFLPVVNSPRAGVAATPVNMRSWADDLAGADNHLQFRRIGS